MSTISSDLAQQSINTIRTLSMDAVQAANSGHPGTPMALAPVAYTLWNYHLNYNPANPCWAGRDRFILSCGHASMLLYSLLHLAEVRETDKEGKPGEEVAVSLEAIKNFRQFESACAGHPEYGEAAGIETTTGPLGQGVANSVGMAQAAKWTAARYGKDSYSDLFEYSVYALCGDGDLMEGIACEAASLAGHWKLDNLCWIYDDNSITIEGGTDLAYSENVRAKFESLGWQVIEVADANDLSALTAAYQAFADCHDRPTLIIVKSVIGYGAPNKAGTAGAHGAPLGEDEIVKAKESYQWEHEKFYVPEQVKQDFSQEIGARGKMNNDGWNQRFATYENEYPKEAAELKLLFSGKLPNDWQQAIPTFEPSEKGLATRVSSGQVLNAVADKIPTLLGGSADLAPSNNSIIKSDNAGHFSAETPRGRNLHFGIREHAMAAICNGMALSGLRSYCATFFVFSDYLRPAMRLSALMRLPVLYIYTHDSIGLGEDGPTHQPIEHLAACRGIPNLLVMRPCDANEVAECYRLALSQKDRPTALVLTRQGLPTFDRSKYGAAEGVAKGGYVLADCEGTPDLILLATGSEVNIAYGAYNQLLSEGKKVRLVSIPCLELFEEQPEAYRNKVLDKTVTARVAVEAGISQGWDRYLGFNGRFVGMKGFGASAPANELFERFGITTAEVVRVAKELL